MNLIKQVSAFRTSDGRLHETEEQAVKAEEKIIKDKSEKTNKKIVEGIRYVNFTWENSESFMDIFSSHCSTDGGFFEADQWEDNFRVIAYRPDNKEEVDALYNYYQNINSARRDEEESIHNSLLKIKNLMIKTF